MKVPRQVNALRGNNSLKNNPSRSHSVANRTGIAPGKTPREVEDGLMKVVPERFLVDAHRWQILHGRHTYQARAPDCGACAIADLCDGKGNTA